MHVADPAHLHVVAQWVEKAENDLTTAVFTLKLGRDSPTDIVCFHAQQCVEKYLKGLLIFYSIDFPKTHNIAAILLLMPPAIRLDISPHDQERLTDYATVTRYPGDYDPITLTETRHAVSVARRVRRHARRLLPKSTLRP